MAARQDDEPRAANARGEVLREGRGRQDVVPADHDEGRGADRGEPLRTRPVPGQDPARLPLDRLRLGLVRVGHGALERGLDVLLLREELGREDPRVEHVAVALLDRDAVRERRPRLDRVQEARVTLRPGAEQRQRAHEPRVAERQLLGDGAAHRGADDVGAAELQVAQERRGVVGHLTRRVDGLGRQVRLPHPAVVEDDDLEVAGERLGLEGPVHRRRRQAADQEHGGARAADLVVHADLVDDGVGHQISRATLIELGSACAVNASRIMSSLKRWVTSGRVRTAPAAMRRSASGNSSW